MADFYLDFVGPGARLAMAAARRAELAAGSIGAVIPDITAARNAALTDIAGARSGALTDIGGARSTALSDIATSRAAAIGQIATDGGALLTATTVQKDLAAGYAAQAAQSVEGVGYLGKSARFPYNNRPSGTGSDFACIAQPSANAGTWLGADGAMVMTVTIPRERLRASVTGQSNINRALIGNLLAGVGANGFYLRLGGSAGVFQSQLAFQMRSSGAQQIAAQLFTIPESFGTRLLIALRRTSNVFTMDVWDCDTGTKYASALAVDVSAFPGMAPTGLGSYFQIGGGGNTNVAPTTATSDNSYRCWDGDIGFVGYYKAALSDAACQNIALGMAIDAATTPATWGYARELDGSAASLSQPAWATGDTTGTAQAIGTLNIARGSSITSKGTYFTIDRKVAGDAHVEALIPGQKTMRVRRPGKVRTTLPGADTIMARALTPDGSIVTDFTTFAAISPTDGTFTGTLDLPPGTYIWQFCLASQRNDPTKWILDATRFSVGYRVTICGQSQASNLRNTTRGLTYKGKTRFSYIEQAGEAATDLTGINCFVVNDRLPPIGDGVVGVMNAIDAAGVDAPVALEWQAVGGTSAIDWIKDSLSGRTWTPMLRANELMDGGRSCFVWNWDAADIAINYNDVLNAVFCGTGPQAGDHFIFGPLSDGGTQVGATVVYMPTMRTNGNGVTESDFDTSDFWGTRRGEGVTWASGKPFAVIGAPPIDMELSDALHPSLTLASGIERHGQHVGFSIVRGLRQDASTNPTVLSMAFTDGTRTAFDIKFNLPNFGILTNGLGATFKTGSDKGVRGVEVSTDGVVAYSKSAVTAALYSPDTVRVSKVGGGSWPVGLKAHLGFGGPGSYGNPASGVTAGNIACRDYWLYDGYSRHVNGRGVPVLPTNTVFTVAG